MNKVTPAVLFFGLLTGQVGLAAEPKMASEWSLVGGIYPSFNMGETGSNAIVEIGTRCRINDWRLNSWFSLADESKIGTRDGHKIVYGAMVQRFVYERKLFLSVGVSNNYAKNDKWDKTVKYLRVGSGLRFKDILLNADILRRKKAKGHNIPEENVEIAVEYIREVYSTYPNRLQALQLGITDDCFINRSLALRTVFVYGYADYWQLTERRKGQYLKFQLGLMLR